MNWHERFLQQAKWTGELRSYLLRQSGLDHAQRVLEIGCGTGAILQDIETTGNLHGIDLDFSRLMEACRHAPFAYLTCADALALPYPAGTFEISFCHFLLLWVREPVQVLREMKRVTQKGGALLALAEPDYGARIDKPASLAVLGRWQTEALRNQGADPELGQRLAELFHQAGIQIIESGPMLAGRQGIPTISERELEWAVLEEDLAGLLPAGELEIYQKLDEEAWKDGTRRMHVPTYFVQGVV